MLMLLSMAHGRLISGSINPQAAPATEETP
jgi:hypothetical protein